MHVIPSCPNMSARYYLPLQHNTISNLHNVTYKNDQNAKIYCNKSKFVYNERCKEYWWNVAVKVKHNKPDVIECDTEEKMCKIIEVSYLAGVNVMLKIKK